MKVISLFLALSLQALVLSSQEVFVLGIAQDAGHPQAGCEQACCSETYTDPSKRHLVSALAIATDAHLMLVDATPDIIEQWHNAKKCHPEKDIHSIFLTHAHMGHYTGLMHLGRESMNAHGTFVYAMPRMLEFLKGNGPWSQLVALGNIDLVPIEDGDTIQIAQDMIVEPIRVPHRDEFSETVGYIITGPNKSLLYIPDIDKWERWELSIETLITRVDYALLDGTFFSSEELPNRDMSEIPHPLVVETMELLKEYKEKVWFIHLNHSNPLLNPDSDAFKEVHDEGFHVTQEGQRFVL